MDTVNVSAGCRCTSEALRTAVEEYERDDAFLSYSNFGDVIDIAAPGHCILSTDLGGYSLRSGTSSAAPHVTAAVGLLAAELEAEGALLSGRQRVGQLTAELVERRTVPQEDPCGFSSARSAEPMLQVSPCEVAEDVVSRLLRGRLHVTMSNGGGVGSSVSEVGGSRWLG